MKKLSIVPDLINTYHINFLDENNMPVLISQKSNIKFNPSTFKKPFITIDNFEKRKYKQIDIKRINIEQLEGLGFRIVSLNCTSKTRNYRGQKKSYMLEDTTNPIPNSQPVVRYPKEHFVEFDLINKRIRIKGKQGYPYLRSQNSSHWREVNDE